MMVSVIVPVKNEADRISSCLDSILAQTYKDYEIIVVDDGSTDGTIDIVKSYIEKNPDKIRLLFGLGLGPGYARNLGVKAARGEILAFIDGDDEINPTYLESIIKHFENPRIAGVFVRIIFHSGPKLWSRVQDAWKWMRWSRETSRFPTALRKSIFEKIGGYNTSLIVGEDYNLYIKIKRHILDHDLQLESETRAIIYIVSEDALLKIFKHSIQFGKNLTRTVKIFPKYGGSILIWSILNGFFPFCILFLILLKPLWWLSLAYLVLYMLLWFSLIFKVSITKSRPYSLWCILLTPILQIVVGLGVVVGFVSSYIKHLLQTDA